MWKKLKLTQEHEWMELGSADTLESLEGGTEAEADDEFVLWTGSIPTDRQEATALVSQVIELNRGRVSQLVFGRLAVEAPSPEAMCSGKCFCISAHGSQRCQVNYCNADNVCWWVDCGSAC